MERAVVHHKRPCLGVSDRAVRKPILERRRVRRSSQAVGRLVPDLSQARIGRAEPLFKQKVECMSYAGFFVGIDILG